MSKYLEMCLHEGIFKSEVTVDLWLHFSFNSIEKGKITFLDAKYSHFLLWLQLKEEIAKLIELKKQLGDEQGSQKFVLKTPKVTVIDQGQCW